MTEEEHGKLFVVLFTVSFSYDLEPRDKKNFRCQEGNSPEVISPLLFSSLPWSFSGIVRGLHVHFLSFHALFSIRSEALITVHTVFIMNWISVLWEPCILRPGHAFLSCRIGPQSQVGVLGSGCPASDTWDVLIVIEIGIYDSKWTFQLRQLLVHCEELVRGILCPFLLDKYLGAAANVFDSFFADHSVGNKASFSPFNHFTCDCDVACALLSLGSIIIHFPFIFSCFLRRFDLTTV